MPVADACIISSISDRVDTGVPLCIEDGLQLYESVDIHSLGELANRVRERLHGRNAYYNVNLHINYSNYCVLRCKFCSFYRPYSKPEPPQTASRAAGFSPRESRRAGNTTTTTHADGYELTISEVVTRAKEAYANGATEVHIVGGLHPTLPFDYYTDLCGSIRRTCPHMHIKAFTAIEIIHFTRIAKPRLSITEVLTKLRQAGLDSMPGGGAEIFDDRVHGETFKNKVGEVEWFEVHRTAHELGIFTNATMLYGHVETRAERVNHLIKLREHQTESLKSRPAHFNCVVPLSFAPNGTELSHLPGPSGLDDLKTLAISRLMCHNIQHIKAFWIMQTPKLAQVSLNWGVDDIDGTVVYYDITKRGGTHQELTLDKLKRLIVEAGCKPVERDSLYRRVIRQGGAWKVDGEPWSVSYDSPRQASAGSVSV